MKNFVYSVTFLVCVLVVSFILGLKGGTITESQGTIPPKAKLELKVSESTQVALASAFAVARLGTSDRTKPELAVQFEDCLGVHTDLTFEEYLSTQVFPKAIKHSVELENFHLQTPAGKEFRVQIKDSENEISDSRQKQLQLFAVDAESLPIPREWPKDLAVEQRWSWFKSLGVVFFHQSKEVYELPGEQVLNIEFRNLKIYDLYWMTPKKTFACRILDCHCF